MVLSIVNNQGNSPQLSFSRTILFGNAQRKPGRLLGQEGLDADLFVQAPIRPVTVSDSQNENIRTRLAAITQRLNSLVAVAEAYINGVPLPPGTSMQGTQRDIDALRDLQATYNTTLNPTGRLDNLIQSQNDTIRTRLSETNEQINRLLQDAAHYLSGSEGDSPNGIPRGQVFANLNNLRKSQSFYNRFLNPNGEIENSIQAQNKQLRQSLQSVTRDIDDLIESEAPNGSPSREVITRLSRLREQQTFYSNLLNPSGRQDRTIQEQLRRFRGRLETIADDINRTLEDAEHYSSGNLGNAPNQTPQNQIQPRLIALRRQQAFYNFVLNPSPVTNGSSGINR